MMFDFIGENNSNELCDISKDQISMQRLLILCSASCETEIIFALVDIFFDKHGIGMSGGGKMSDKGKIVIISGFSAAGKGMVVQALIDKYSNYETIVQTTSRKRRDGWSYVKI